MPITQNDWLELDENTWQAWIKKNEARDKLRSAKRVRFVTLFFAIAGVTAFLWRFA
jgi:hypothetical protein